MASSALLLLIAATANSGGEVSNPERKIVEQRFEYACEAAPGRIQQVIQWLDFDEVEITADLDISKLKPAKRWDPVAGIYVIGHSKEDAIGTRYFTPRIQGGEGYVSQYESSQIYDRRDRALKKYEIGTQHVPLYFSYSRKLKVVSSGMSVDEVVNVKTDLDAKGVLVSCSSGSFTFSSIKIRFYSYTD